MSITWLNQSAIDHAGDVSQAVIRSRLRAIIYCRVSTDKQEADGESLEYQEEKCRQYAALHGYEVILVLKEAKSGFIHYSLREKLTTARRMVRDGLADVIIVFDLRRFSRNFVHSAMIFEEIEEAGGSVVSISENIDNSLTGKLIRSILAWSAESERHKIVEYANRHWQSRVEQKLPIATGRAPYGWQWGDEEKTYYILHKEEAFVRYSLFQMFVELDLSLRAIAHKLTENGIPTPEQARGVKKAGTAWYPSTVQLFLKDPANIGILTICKRKRILTPEGKTRLEPHPNEVVIPGGLPAIVTLSLYERAQHKLATNQVEKSHPPRDPEEYLLKGHVYCKVCGNKMVGKMKVSQENYPYHYYRCGNNSSRYIQCPVLPMIRTTPVNHYVWQECCCLLERLEPLQEQIEQNIQEQMANLLENTKGRGQIVELEQLLAYAEAERDKHPEGSYYRLLIERDIQTKTEQLERYKEEQGTAQEITSHAALYTQRLQEFLTFLRVQRGNYRNATFQQKRNALDVLGVQVTISAPPAGGVCDLGNDQEWFSVREVSKITGMAVRTIYKCIESGRLPAKRIGASMLLHKDALLMLQRGDPFRPGREPAQKAERGLAHTPRNTLQSLKQRVLITYSPLLSAGIWSSVEYTSDTKVGHLNP